jgi:2-dehydro-3-deoxyphosphogalactonate aldolase
MEEALAALPLIAILRGISPGEAQRAATILHAAGFRLVEVPLNSPQPFDSIAAIRSCLPPDVIVGAGTVTALAEVRHLAELRADMVVMPHADTEVIAEAKARGMVCVPGIATPTEAFAALKAGADGLKIFPAELIGPRVIKALKAVLPRGIRLIPVGGIAPDTMKPFVEAGATGFGLGSALYSAGMPLDHLAERAKRFVAAWQDLTA